MFNYVHSQAVRYPVYIALVTVSGNVLVAIGSFGNAQPHRTRTSSLNILCGRSRRIEWCSPTSSVKPNPSTSTDHQPVLFQIIHMIGFLRVVVHATQSGWFAPSAKRRRSRSSVVHISTSNHTHSFLISMLQIASIVDSHRCLQLAIVGGSFQVVSSLEMSR